MGKLIFKSTPPFEKYCSDCCASHLPGQHHKERWCGKCYLKHEPEFKCNPKRWCVECRDSHTEGDHTKQSVRDKHLPVLLKDVVRQSDPMASVSTQLPLVVVPSTSSSTVAQVTCAAEPGDWDDVARQMGLDEVDVPAYVVDMLANMKFGGGYKIVCSPQKPVLNPEVIVPDPAKVTLLDQHGKEIPSGVTLDPSNPSPAHGPTAHNPGGYL